MFISQYYVIVKRKDQRHNRKILRTNRGRLAVHSRAAQRERQVRALDIACRSARLSCRAFVPKKSFSIQLADLPIQKIDLSLSDGSLGPPSKTLAAPSRRCFFQLWI